MTVPVPNERLARSAVAAIMMAVEGGVDDVSRVAVIREILADLPNDAIDDGQDPVRRFIAAVKRARGEVQVAS
jgi:hypothetical protein